MNKTNRPMTIREACERINDRGQKAIWLDLETSMIYFCDREELLELALMSSPYIELSERELLEKSETER